MQNKGFVKFIAVLLTLICLFYMSFSVVTKHCNDELAEIRAQKGDQVYRDSLESMLSNNVYKPLGWAGVNWGWTLKECREIGIGLGLDLEGGYSATLEVKVADVIKALSDHKEKDDPAFEAACDSAASAIEHGKNGQSDFITLFIKEYQSRSKKPLASLFATDQLLGKVTPKSTDDEVKKVLQEEVKAAIDNSFNVLRSRIDRFGVAQPNIQAIEGQEGRIMVELPGIEEADVPRVKSLLEGSANLQFFETFKGNDELAPVYQGLKAADEMLATGVKVSKDSVSKDSASASTSNKSQDHPLLSDKRLALNPDGSCIIGYTKGTSNMTMIDSMLSDSTIKALLPKDLSLKWGVKSDKDKDGKETGIYALYAIKVDPQDPTKAPMDGSAISSAKDDYDQNGKPCVSMTMNADGARDWAELTKKNVNRCVAIVLDDRVYSAPNVMNEITGGNSQITGNFDLQETKDLSNVLRSGKMPAPATVVQSQFVGPSMGKQSIVQGIWSCVIAFLILMIYMIVMYGFIPGMVANGALILNLFFTVGILTSFQAALTMSGIAGMVLSLGMAVDANVLIYERTKEEMKAGKKVREALAAGYSNAFSAIFDSNLTSIITGVILYIFGSGPIRGFALTLIIGIVISFFTAVFLTRIVYEGRMAKDKWLNLTFRSSIGDKISFQDPKYKFMSAYKTSFAIFGAFAIISIGFMFTRGFSKSIDFSGGRNYVVTLDKVVEPEQAREALNDAFPNSNTSVIALGTTGKELRISTNYKIDQTDKNVDNEISNIIKSKLPGAKVGDAQMVGPSVAKDITRGAVYSILLAFVAIFIYILARFRNVAFSVGAITALFFDIILILGMYSICWGWMPFSLEIDQTFIGAILTAIGYSINDKVVVFDRIREFIGLYPKRERQSLFNTAVNTTLNRTINTSVSTFIVLAVIFCLGGASIRSFAFAMILGVVFGTLSSIFVAVPTAYLTMGKRIKEKEGEE